ncbi:DinB family protein [soil metagenome]
MYKPTNIEYPEYYKEYVNMVETEDIISYLEDQQKSTNELLKNITNEQSLSRYKENKWSIREIVGHLSDAERIFSTRVLRIARNDITPQPGFEENEYVLNAHFDNIKFVDLINSLYYQRASDVALFRTLNEEELLRTGIANNGVFSVRAMIYVIAGHEKHHIDFMKKNYPIDPVESA